MYAPQGAKGSSTAYSMAAFVICLLSIFSKDFSEITVPISISFHMQPPGKEGKKVYIFGPGHMTKMADMPIYGTNLKYFFLQNHRVVCL